MKTSLQLLSTGMLFLSAITGFTQPVITAQPADQSVSLGATVTNQVTARPTAGTLRYQWWFESSLLAAATNRTLVLTNVQAAQAGAYYAAVTDDIGSTNSRVANLKIDPTFTKITTGAIVTDREGDHQCHVVRL